MDEKDFGMLRVLNETQNITKCAEQLYITQSALSKRIKAVEREFGTELILRSRQGVRFTTVGEEVLLHCSEAAKRLDVMYRSLDSMSSGVRGTLNAVISVNYALYRLPGTIAEYHKKYPKVKLQITTRQSRHLYRSMMGGTLDVAILRGEYPWDGVKYLRKCKNFRTAFFPVVRNNRSSGTG